MKINVNKSIVVGLGDMAVARHYIGFSRHPYFCKGDYSTCNRWYVK